MAGDAVRIQSATSLTHRGMLRRVASTTQPAAMNLLAVEGAEWLWCGSG
jgi:hypothetical protein